MAKPKRNDDRRAVVEQMRKEQQRKERQRTFLALGIAALVGAVIIGLAVVQLRSENKKKQAAQGTPLASLGVSQTAAGCQKVTTKSADGNQDHRTEGVAIDYPDAPPAFGPHWPNYLQGSEIRKLYTVDDRPPVERLVHSLEHGHTILWYDETIADKAASVDALRAIAAKFPSSTDLNDKFIAAPWTKDDGAAFPDGTHVALTHWSMGGTNGNPKGQIGVWEYCADVSGAVVESFMKDYPYTDSPEPSAP